MRIARRSTQFDQVFTPTVCLVFGKIIDLMNSFGSENALPDGFDGQVKLFPLPNLVLFPGVIQALHIFEPRYRELIQDALAGDRLVTMATIDPDVESKSELAQPIFPTVCIGKLITHHRLDDGRYNVLLMGVKRARVAEELVGNQPYRMAQVELIPETCSGLPGEVQQRRLQLIELFRRQSDPVVKDNELMANLTNPDLPFGMLVDLIGFSCGPKTQSLYKMLNMADAWDRSEFLLGLVETLRQEKNDAERPLFPPDFSRN